MEKEKVFCPINDWECPYWGKDGECKIDNPMEECDDYYAMFGAWTSNMYISE